MTPKEIREIIEKWFYELTQFRNTGTRLVRVKEIQTLLNQFQDEEKPLMT